MKELILTHLAGLDFFADGQDPTNVTLLLRAQTVTGDEYELVIAPEFAAQLLEACADIARRVENGIAPKGRTKHS